MLPNTSSPNQSSTLIHGPEEIQSIRQNMSRLQSHPPVPTFESSKHYDESEQEEEEPITTEESRQAEIEDDSIAEMLIVTSNKDFQELLDRFLMIGYEKILTLRSEMRQQRGLQTYSLFGERQIHSRELQSYRSYLYNAQMTLFESPKGIYYDIAI